MTFYSRGEDYKHSMNVHKSIRMIFNQYVKIIMINLLLYNAVLSVYSNIFFYFLLSYTCSVCCLAEVLVFCFVC